jgi:hypothetical protein
MKKSHPIASLLLLTVLTAVAACHGSGENKALKGITALPHFILLSLDSSHIINSDQIPAGTPSVFFYFDPNCEHCQKETRGIIQHRQEFKNVRFYYLSNASIKAIDSFSHYFRLDSMPNVFVGTDFQYTFFNAFLPSSVPYMAVYNNQKILAQVYNGEADLKSLITSTRN